MVHEAIFLLAVFVLGFFGGVCWVCWLAVFETYIMLFIITISLSRAARLWLSTGPKYIPQNILKLMNVLKSLSLDLKVWKNNLQAIPPIAVIVASCKTSLRWKAEPSLKACGNLLTCSRRGIIRGVKVIKEAKVEKGEKGSEGS